MGTMARRADMSMAEACTQVNEAQGTGEDGGRRSGGGEGTKREE